MFHEILENNGVSCCTEKVQCKQITR